MDNMGKGKVLHQMDQRKFLLYPKHGGTWDKLWWQMVLPVCILNPSFRDGVDEHGPDNLLGFGNDFLIFLGEELQIFPCHYIS